MTNMEQNEALVDDHHLVRNGLAATVNALGGYRVTLEAGNGRELIEVLATAEAPAIATVDLNMPVMDGNDNLAWMRGNALVAKTTPRAMKVLRLVSDDGEFTYVQIADRMGVHRRTVDHFRMGLFEMFAITSKTGLVLFAMRWKLVDTGGE